MIRLTGTQRVLLTAGSAVGALTNPLRGDLVATLGETTGTTALVRMRDKMRMNSEGLQILKDRPRITEQTMDMGYLSDLPSNTFGHHYYQFMNGNGLSAQRAETKFVEDEELAYVMTRYRENHDFLHTLTGLGVTVPEEICLKWYEMVQTELPMCALSAMFGPIPLSLAEKRLLLREQIPWGLACGRASAFFMNIYFERELETDIDVMRRRYKISVAPKSSDAV